MSSLGILSLRELGVPFQSGRGVPNHDVEINTRYFDLDTMIEYINIDGTGTGWVDINNNILNLAKNYADGVGSSTLSSANNYANGVGSSTLSSANTYTSTNAVLKTGLTQNLPLNNFSIIRSVTGSLGFSGIMDSLTMATTISVGTVCYLASDGMRPASNTSQLQCKATHIAVESGIANDTKLFMSNGFYKNTAGLSGLNLTKSSDVFLDSNGGFTMTLPSSGNYCNNLGKVFASDIILFEPSWIIFKIA